MSVTHLKFPSLSKIFLSRGSLLSGISTIRSLRNLASRQSLMSSLSPFSFPGLAVAKIGEFHGQFFGAFVIHLFTFHNSILSLTFSIKACGIGYCLIQLGFESSVFINNTEFDNLHTELGGRLMLS